MYPGVKIAKILICYTQWQQKYDDIQGILGDRVSFHQGLPTHEMIMDLTRDQTKFSLIILDDLMDQASKSHLVRDLFVSICHHRSLYCYLLLQNLYTAGKEMRTITLSAQALILTRSVHT
mgnify:CR=1 FL=1